MDRMRRFIRSLRLLLLAVTFKRISFTKSVTGVAFLLVAAEYF